MALVHASGDCLNAHHSCRADIKCNFLLTDVEKACPVFDADFKECTSACTSAVKALAADAVGKDLAPCDCALARPAYSVYKQCYHNLYIVPPCW